MNLREQMLKNEANFKSYACFDKDAIYLREIEPDMRPAYFRDVDKILHSSSYTRYLDKTQVFSFADNDNITKRIVHVSLVSKLARTIGRALSVNEDLIEAMALGHDLGHVPFGHLGESILNNLTLKYNNTYFNHNVQSVRLLMDVENNGKGLNITVQTLDGILCHNGELVLSEYKPVVKDKETFLKEYELCYTDKEQIKKLRPLTIEGCIVRICDVIAYIGRDIEDAIMLNIIKKEDIPSDIADVLGTDNSSIINTILLDVINNSMDKNYIKMSDEVFNALTKLMKFNYEYIYNKVYSAEEKAKYTEVFNYLFKFYLDNINNPENDINVIYLNGMDENYLNNTSNEQKVIDYIAGMTDDFIMKQYNKYKVGE